MAIYGAFSYKGTPGSLKEAVGIRIDKRIKTRVDLYAKRLTKSIREVALTWQLTTRIKLSVAAKNKVNNTTPYPKRRTGKLMASIRRPKVTIEEYADSRKNYGNFKLKATGLFANRPAPNISDVGWYLNAWTGKSFAGWRNRAQRSLLDEMKKRAVEVL